MKLYIFFIVGDIDFGFNVDILIILFVVGLIG